MSRQLQGISFKGVTIGKPGIGKSEILLTDLPTTSTFKPLNRIIQEHSFRSDRNHPESPGKCASEDNVPTSTVRAPKLPSFALDGKDDRSFFVSGANILIANQTKTVIQKTRGHASPSVIGNLRKFPFGVVCPFFQLLKVRINRMNQKFELFGVAVLSLLIVISIYSAPVQASAVGFGVSGEIKDVRSTASAWADAANWSSTYGTPSPGNIYVQSGDISSDGAINPYHRGSVATFQGRASIGSLGIDTVARATSIVAEEPAWWIPALNLVIHIRLPRSVAAHLS